MNKEQQLDLIYKTIALPDTDTIDICSECGENIVFMDGHYWCRDNCCDCWLSEGEWDEKEVEAGLKDVLIGDILDWWEELEQNKNCWSDYQEDVRKDIIDSYTKKRLPIEEQSKNCIKEIADLILKTQELGQQQ